MLTTSTNKTKNLDVVAMLLFKDDNILIAQRPRGDKLQGLWEFPGGKVEEGESLEEALVREIFEEFNIYIRVKKHFTTVNSLQSKISLHAFFCEFINGEIILNSHSEMVWVKIKDLKSYEMPPLDIEIVDELSLHF